MAWVVNCRLDRDIVQGHFEFGDLRAKEAHSVWRKPMVANHDTGCTLARLRAWQVRQLRRSSILVTILCVELLALTLLYLGYGVFQSLGITSGAGAVYVIFPSLLGLVLLIAPGVRTTIQTLAMRMRDRRTYHFSLKSLLLAVLLIAIACAWYGHRVRRVRAEQRMLEGKWRLVSVEGQPITFPEGTPAVCEFEFASGMYAVDPTQNPKWLDIHAEGETSRAIYRWEGTRLHVMGVSPGVQRPTSFDASDLAVKPGAKITLPSAAEYFLERLPK